MPQMDDQRIRATDATAVQSIALGGGALGLMHFHELDIRVTRFFCG
jgi:hypothetical protein